MIKDTGMEYSRVYDMLRKEKITHELQKIDEELLYNINVELLNLAKKKNKTIFTSSNLARTEKEELSMHKMLKELYERRTNKIIQMSILKHRGRVIEIDYEAFLDKEKSFFDEFSNLLNKYEGENEEEVELMENEKGLTKIEQALENIEDHLSDISDSLHCISENSGK